MVGEAAHCWQGHCQTHFGIYPGSGLCSRLRRSQHHQGYETFRAMLVEARKMAGLSQADLAEKLRRPQSFVSKFERGERRLDVIEFWPLAEALEVDPIKFLKRFRQAVQQ